MDILWFVIGVVVVALGLAVSIALHEVGHLVPAKLFGVRVTQYMVGFGPTVFSRRRGETEYGVKAIPLGGYVSMVGMLPPPDGDAHHARAASTGLVQQMGQLSQEARTQAAEEITAADEGRQFIQLPVWKRVVIMLGGPFMNLLIAAAVFAVLVTTFGVATPTTTVSEVHRCVVTVEEQQQRQAAGDAQECHAGDPPAPAHEAGLEPGDTITSFAGTPVQEWDELTALIRPAAGETVDITWERDGREMSGRITPLLTERPVTDSSGRPVAGPDGTARTEEVGFVGMGSEIRAVRQPITETGPLLWNQITAVVDVVFVLPQKLWETAVAVVTPAERDPNGPMSVVGVGRIAGEAAAHQDIPLKDKAAFMLSLVAGVNVALMVFNLIPLLPLDGGHVAGALYEGIRRGIARLRGRPDPGPFDISKLLPLTYVVAAAMLLMGVLLIVADIVEPVQIF